MIFSLGVGNWTVSDTSKELNSKKALHDFDQGKFARITHEGSIGSRFLYVVGIGMNATKTSTQYDYTGISTNSKVSDLESDISMVEAKLGLKYNVMQWLYVGTGTLTGDFQISYDRDSYISSGADLANYSKSENQNYFGHYYEAGVMFATNSFGLRVGTEINSIRLQKNLKTIGNTQPVLDSSKLYLEILWKN
jgi:opacity protein-like surface antigen